MAINSLKKIIYILYTKMWGFYATSQMGNLLYTKAEILIFTQDAV